MNKDSNKKNSGLAAIAFILQYMKKYWIALIFVVVFISATTYFNVLAPKLLGDGIDTLISYVVDGTGEEIKQDILEGRGISEDRLSDLEETGAITKQQHKDLSSASAADMQKMMELKDEQSKIFYNYDSSKNQNVIDGLGFNDEQLTMIQDSTVFDQTQKTQIEMLNKIKPIQIKSMYITGMGGLTQTDKDILKTADEEKINSTYNIVNVRNTAIAMDKQFVLDNGVYTHEQIKYIQEQKLSTSEENSVKLSVDELKDVAKSQNIKLDSKGKYNEFLHALFLLILSYIALSLAMFIYNILMAVVSGKTARDIRQGLFGKIQRLSIKFFDQGNTGDILSRFTNDIDNISNALNQSLVQVLSQIALLVGILYMMFKEDTSTLDINMFGIDMTMTNVLVWTLIIFAIVAIILAGFIIKKANYYVGKQQEKLGDLNGFIDERISGQKQVIAYGLEDESIEGFEKYNNDLKKTSISGQIYSGMLMPLMQGIGLINLGALVFLGAIFISRDLMSVGLLVAFIQYSQRFFNPLAQIVAQYNMMELAATGANRVKEVFSEDEDVINQPGAVEIEGIDGEVSIENVNFGYYPETLVLKDINIPVKKGQRIALVGPTGSGKTTVMNLMNRFYDINSGDIKIDGKSIKDITLKSLRQNTGIVLQESVLFTGTVFENIAYGKDNATQQEVEDAARLANIHEYIMTLESGYETEINNSTTMLSTGQKQLIAIARTIITNPDLLILDEATSNVDTVTEAKIQKAMENVLKNRTSFVIAHRLKTILNADEIIFLKEGQIMERGSHSELLKKDGYYAELYYNQFVVE